MLEASSLYKLMILYMLRESAYPLTNTQILDFFLEKGYTDYFHLQEALSALVEDHLADMETVRNTTTYRPAPRGQRIAASLEQDLSREIRTDIIHYLREHDYELRSNVSVVADYHRTPGQDYFVRCQVYEERRTIFELALTVPSEETARTICAGWKEKSARLYGMILSELGS